MVKTKLLNIIKKNKETIKERERKRYRSMTDIEANGKKSLERYCKLKAHYKE